MLCRSTVRGVGISIGKRTGVSRVVVELALLHPLEAKSVPAQRRVRHELRLEFTDCDRRLRAEKMRNVTQPKSNARCAPCGKQHFREIATLDWVGHFTNLTY